MPTSRTGFLKVAPRVPTRVLLSLYVGLRLQATDRSTFGIRLHAAYELSQARSHMPCPTIFLRCARADGPVREVVCAGAVPTGQCGQSARRALCPQGRIAVDPPVPTGETARIAKRPPAPAGDQLHARSAPTDRAITEGELLGRGLPRQNTQGVITRDLRLQTGLFQTEKAAAKLQII